MNTRHTSIRTLALLALLTPVACDDPELMPNEELLLSDDPDEVDAAFDSALDQLNDEVDPAAVTYASAASFSAANKLYGFRSFGTTDAITVDLWVNLPAASTGEIKYIVVGGNTAGKFGLMELSGKLWTVKKGGASCDTGISIPLNKWTHIAMTHVNATDTSKFYINGILTASGCGSLNDVETLAGNLFVGGANNSYSFPGTIDQIRVWNVARSEADIQKLMLTSGSTVISTSLKAYYKLDGTGADSATGGVALTVAGTPWSESKSPPVTGATFFNATTKRGYLATSTTATWDSAKSTCAASTGWALATINDATEDTYIDGTVLGVANTSRYWIGYNDRDNNSSYLWTNGEVSAYKDGTPALTKGQCMADNTLVGAVYDAWAPRLCTEANRYICEYRFL